MYRHFAAFSRYNWNNGWCKLSCFAVLSFSAVLHIINHDHSIILAPPIHSPQCFKL